MNDTVMKNVADAIGTAGAPEPERPARPVLATRQPAAPAPTPVPVLGAKPRLEEAIGALPVRFLRAAREAARLTDSVTQWDEVERAFDALVSDKAA